MYSFSFETNVASVNIYNLVKWLIASQGVYVFFKRQTQNVIVPDIIFRVLLWKVNSTNLFQQSTIGWIIGPMVES